MKKSCCSFDGNKFDLIIVGGGINGVGIARDAAGRGLKVLLCEQDDLGSHTSSSSSKLIHGGFRYLEQYEFGLVSKALAEREVLLRSAPHIISPVRFVMPHVDSLRPVWLIRIGLFLYDHLDFGKRKLLPSSRVVKLAQHPAGAPLKSGFIKGFVFSDACVDDSRLVVLNAMDAKERGATILTRTKCVSTRRTSTSWFAILRDLKTGEEQEVEANCLVNAAGAWVNKFICDQAALKPQQNTRLIKGSHIVVKKLFEHNYSYAFQHTDGRIIFVCPWEQDFTLIGTTDVEFSGDIGEIKISNDEVNYLCDSINQYFDQQIQLGDVVWSYAGVRPLLDDESSDLSGVTRDYKLEIDTDGAPMMSIYGGKITTYRKLAEDALTKLKSVIDIKQSNWTNRDAPLPGGDIKDADFSGFLSDFQKQFPWLPDELAHRYARNYGTRAQQVLGRAKSLNDLGEDIGDGLYAAELDYLINNEWALTEEDILWRRSKLGLSIGPVAISNLNSWLKDRKLEGMIDVRAHGEPVSA
ncbi:MAG: glycerol-3-phosphate dehydrogenase [Arenicella sp.]|nr:glycerol-3-phosphate dehydrogenase [Arenicella sp.]